MTTNPVRPSHPMHIVIMGCGRVGSTVARMLEQRGHTVAVVDQNDDAFRRLGDEFTGRRVTGIGFDRDVLVKSGVERANAFVAVSSGDNSNILAARVARETFGVHNVVARIYDPGRAEVYQRLGIPTVATVRWTADQVIRRILPEGAEPDWRDPTGTIRLTEIHVDQGWVGLQVPELERLSGVRVAFLTRHGEGLLPAADTVLQDGDLVHVVVPEVHASQAESILARGPAASSEES